MIYHPPQANQDGISIIGRLYSISSLAHDIPQKPDFARLLISPLFISLSPAPRRFPTITITRNILL